MKKIIFLILLIVTLYATVSILFAGFNAKKILIVTKEEFYNTYTVKKST